MGSLKTHGTVNSLADCLQPDGIKDLVMFQVGDVKDIMSGSLAGFNNSLRDVHPATDQRVQDVVEQPESIGGFDFEGGVIGRFVIVKVDTQIAFLSRHGFVEFPCPDGGEARGITQGTFQQKEQVS